MLLGLSSSASAMGFSDTIVSIFDFWTLLESLLLEDCWWSLSRYGIFKLELEEEFDDFYVDRIDFILFFNTNLY